MNFNGPPRPSEAPKGPVIGPDEKDILTVLKELEARKAGIALPEEAADETLEDTLETDAFGSADLGDLVRKFEEEREG